MVTKYHFRDFSPKILTSASSENYGKNMDPKYLMLKITLDRTNYSNSERPGQLMITFPVFLCGKNGKNNCSKWKKYFFQFFQVQYFKGTMKFQIRAIYWG